VNSDAVTRLEVLVLRKEAVRVVDVATEEVLQPIVAIKAAAALS